MGLFWDMVQQSQIEDQKKQSSSLEGKVANLEAELEKTQRLLIKTLKELEMHLNVDIDGDGGIG